MNFMNPLALIHTSPPLIFLRFHPTVHQTTRRHINAVHMFGSTAESAEVKCTQTYGFSSYLS